MRIFPLVFLFVDNPYKETQRQINIQCMNNHDDAHDDYVYVLHLFIIFSQIKTVVRLLSRHIIKSSSHHQTKP